MSVKILGILEQTARYLFFAAVLASFVFLGWRVATKRAYVEHEKAQCEAFAVSAALTAAEAISEDGTLARLVKELGKAEFVTDHMIMPTSSTVSVTIEVDGLRFLIKSTAASGWNSRSPQRAEFKLVLEPSEEVFCEEKDDAKRAARFIAARNTAVRIAMPREHLFTFPNERPCPAPFTAVMATAEGLSNEPVYLLVLKDK